METIARLNTLASRVEMVLSKYPESRNSDIVLQAKLCNMFYPPFERPITNWDDFVSVMRTLPTEDHIARARRNVIKQHDYKKYLPTDPDIAKARRINMEVWSQWATQPKPIGNNYPPDVQNKLDTTGRTDIDD